MCKMEWTTTTKRWTVISGWERELEGEVHYSASLHHGPPKSHVLGDAEEQCRSSTSELPLWSGSLHPLPGRQTHSLQGHIGRPHGVSVTYFSLVVCSICCCSVNMLCLTLYDPMDCSMPGLRALHHLLEFTQTHVHWVSDAIQLFYLCPLLLLPSVFPSIRVFSSELALHIRWPKYQSFSISRSSEYSGLISFRMDWLDLLAVQETLKSLLQNHS